MKRIPDAKIHYASAGAVRRHRPADPARPTGIQLNYAMRYLLRMIFNLAIDQDDDGNAAGGRGKTAPAAEERRVRTVVPAPKHALKQNGIAERAITKRYEQAVRSVGPSQPFPASEAGKAFSPRFPRAGGWLRRAQSAAS